MFWSQDLGRGLLCVHPPAPSDKAAQQQVGTAVCFDSGLALQAPVSGSNAIPTPESLASAARGCFRTATAAAGRTMDTRQPCMADKP